MLFIANLVDEELILVPSNEPFTCYKDILPNIAVVRLYPDMSSALLKAALTSSVKGLFSNCMYFPMFSSINDLCTTEYLKSQPRIHK